MTQRRRQILAAKKKPREPLFHGEGAYAAAYKHNKRWAKSGPYQTKLSPANERRFKRFARGELRRVAGVKATKDYDYRGWWRDHKHGKGLKPGHFTDRYKTPFDTSFSNQSKYAKKGTPFVWRTNRRGRGILVNRKNGRLILRESEE